MSFYPQEELENLGLKAFGKNVLISNKCSIYGAENITLGNDVRIDDSCILSGKINIGSNVHIGAFCALFAGEAGIVMGDYSGLSSGVRIYAVSDDYSGNYLTNPTVPVQFRNVQAKQVVLEKHVIVGAGSIILPGVEIGEGGAVGAMSLVTKSVHAWTIVTGNPARHLKNRSKKLLDLI